MPQFLNIPYPLPFTELMNHVTDYLHPFRAMWPVYWLKAVAIRDPQEGIWRLSYFALVGRWTEQPQTMRFTDRGQALAAISEQLQTDDAWDLLTTLQREGVVSFDGITAHVPVESTAPQSYWQTAVPPKMYAADLAPVIEAARWRYLYLYGNILWQSDPVHSEQVRQGFRLDLAQRDEFDFGTYTRTAVGQEYQFSEFNFRFDFPLALDVVYGIPNMTNQIPLTVSCHRPLTLDALHVRPGVIWAESAQERPIQALLYPQPEGVGWSDGTVMVPAECEKIWLSSEQLHNRLAYPVPTVTPEEQLAAVIGRVYHKNIPNEGKQRWRRHLLDSSGPAFEVALHNAIARFGITVLFAGEERFGEQPTGEVAASRKQGSAAATGYDLIACDLAAKRAVLISAKGSDPEGRHHPPTPEAYKNLLDEVAAARSALQGWQVSAVIACQVPENKLVPHRQRPDVRVWSREDLERLLQAKKHESILALVWGSTPTHTRFYAGRSF
jgi:hypothetical protein